MYYAVAIVIVLIVVAVKKLDTKQYIEMKSPSKCKHGYENWDDCPDCCH